MALLGASSGIKLGYRPPQVEQAPDADQALTTDEDFQTSLDSLHQSENINGKKLDISNMQRGDHK